MGVCDMSYYIKEEGVNTLTLSINEINKLLIPYEKNRNYPIGYILDKSIFYTMVKPHVVSRMDNFYKFYDEDYETVNHIIRIDKKVNNDLQAKLYKELLSKKHSYVYIDYSITIMCNVICINIFQIRYQADFQVNNKNVYVTKLNNKYQIKSDDKLLLDDKFPLLYELFQVIHKINKSKKTVLWKQSEFSNDYSELGIVTFNIRKPLNDYDQALVELYNTVNYDTSVLIKIDSTFLFNTFVNGLYVVDMTKL